MVAVITLLFLALPLKLHVQVLDIMYSKMNDTKMKSQEKQVLD